MCTYVVEKTPIAGCGSGAEGWFDLKEANVSYDHPFNAPYEHALNIDFTNEAEGPGARVAVELSADSARALVAAILEALERGEEAERREMAG
ncbi:MAG: DUF6295 family protein [Dehalococcoidia bacterium]|nr:DUF6295 family protein [Dehalococcoidia bacterium]